MKKTDILIIGGGPAGLVAAITARKNNPSKKITLARESKKCVVPCGLPYIFNRLKSVENDVISDKAYAANKIDLMINRVIKIDSASKKVNFNNHKNIKYDKLVLATGSRPVKISIDGAELDGVYQIRKNIKYLENLRKAIIKSKNIVIIGGGFIGVELAEELSAMKNKNISVVEILDHCLIANFDEEFAILGEKKIKKKGVKIYLKTKVEKIVGENKVKAVKFKNGKQILADLVIMAVGSRPDVQLAESAGVKIVNKDGISVDRFMRTSVSDIFAIGDCSETKNFFTKESNLIMLASVACYEARIAGANLYRVSKNLIKNRGTIAVFSTYLDGLVLGSAGLSENDALKNKIKIVIGTAEAPNHHPIALLNTHKIKIKFIFDFNSKILLGGQIAAPENSAELINLISLAIQQKMTAQELTVLQVATHPLITAPPTAYPIIKAAEMVL